MATHGPSNPTVPQPVPSVPPERFDVQAPNEIGLAVYDHLVVASRACGDLLRERGQSPYLNLVAVFFHEFQKVLSHHFILAYEGALEPGLWGAERSLVSRLASASRTFGLARIGFF